MGRLQGSGFRVQGSGLRVQGSGLRVQGSGFRAQGSGLQERPFLLLTRSPCTTRGPSWGHPMLVLGALGSFLEPFCEICCRKLTISLEK